MGKSTEKRNASGLIGKNEKSEEIIKQNCDSGETDINMGSNVSRHSGKGLSGRRTRSSGDLCNENDETPNGSCNTPNNKRKSENGKSNAIYEHHHHHQQHDENTAESCPVNTATKLMMAPLCVSKKDRNKFCGSLPNHLDADDVCGETAHTAHTDNNNTLDRVEYVTVAPKKNHTPHQIESSPYHNSSSEKESTSSSTNLGSTFRSNHGVASDV
ncbi:hypothetical protein Bhyg_12729 [Pseudolycoriella hygida]|uniref:Uncharacterized protein n=1 Tax=Pseudolycoriella hygida TaxID=35572 RepID=A0A9Q0MXT8_9DIPT|nr:hypothetical protein Bhyg_12729 [Pseudolycoriella hygida]